MLIETPPVMTSGSNATLKFQLSKNEIHHFWLFSKWQGASYYLYLNVSRHDNVALNRLTVSQNEV
ncbi:CLUMA_CG014643, isoform A [Clunio marinus]|uniref:CLUMA_CG014643, isoform A n=1 Tax=Clunio marinus TaxID=568069 RepID=A0A1J1IQI3_9DIPT|nr:CLUMA_CG014643, isoform A [Clunio marinus]